jgi:hypothetical protein
MATVLFNAIPLDERRFSCSSPLSVKEGFHFGHEDDIMSRNLPLDENFGFTFSWKQFWIC